MPHEYLPPDGQMLRWVTSQLHRRARVSAVEPMVGGLTAFMDRITVELPTGARHVVLRRWASDEWADGLVAREASALAALRGSEVPAPELLASDEDGAHSGARCTLTSALEGEPDLAPADLRSWLVQLAATQAAIHTVPERALPRWDGWYEDGAPLAWLEDRGLRAAAREAASGRRHLRGPHRLISHAWPPRRPSVSPPPSVVSPERRSPRTAASGRRLAPRSWARRPSVRRRRWPVPARKRARFPRCGNGSR